MGFHILGIYIQTFSFSYNHITKEKIYWLKIYLSRALSIHFWFCWNWELYDPGSGGWCKMKRFVDQQNNLLIQYRGKLFNIYSGDRCRCKHSRAQAKEKISDKTSDKYHESMNNNVKQETNYALESPSSEFVNSVKISTWLLLLKHWICWIGEFVPMLEIEKCD